MSPGVVDERRVLWIIALSAPPNIAGALLVFVLQNVVMPDPASTTGDVQRAAVRLAAYGAVAIPIAGVLGFFLLRPVLLWLRDRRPPTERERDATLNAPRRTAAMGFAFWIGGALLFWAFAVADGDPARQMARDGISTLLGGLTTAVLSFLLVESWLRPVVAMALAGEAPPPRRTAGIAPRILLSWALGSGVPLVAIAMAQFRFDPAVAPPTPGALVFLSALGLGSGALLLLLAAKSVAQPIAAVREALHAVEAGDDAVSIAVDDAGQIGQLQAGFNAMVLGVRERRELEDLFGRYVGPEVAAEALHRGTDLGGEQRRASTLFVDLIGSSELAQRVEPAAVVSTLNQFFAAVVSVVQAEGGWVNKFEGDGAMCVFGAPADQPDHATRALRAARVLRSELAGVARRLPAVDAGIGVSSGAVVAGHVGAVERFEYTVIGDPVNEAARLTEAAKDEPGRVLASAAAVEAADPDERARWVRVADLELRGRRGPTTAYAPEC
ncbi:MAG TPA: adenylate/guanylate cyclase domain-containing protein [Acidimicrobiales bacterium]